MIIGILIMMFGISWQMTLVSLVLVPLSFVLIGIIVKKSQHYFKEQQDSLANSTATSKKCTPATML